MPLVIKKGEVVLNAKPPVLGKHFQNKVIQFFDGRCGTYWEANHVAIDPDEKRIQKALTKKRKAVKVKIQYNYTDEVRVLLEN